MGKNATNVAQSTQVIYFIHMLCNSMICLFVCNNIGGGGGGGGSSKIH
jgi:hypothetical protein